MEDEILFCCYCIINDGISDNIGLKLPENNVNGKEFDHDFSLDSTKSGYDFLVSFYNRDTEENTDDTSNQDETSDDKKDGEKDSNSSNTYGNDSDNNSQDKENSKIDNNTENSDKKQEFEKDRDLEEGADGKDGENESNANNGETSDSTSNGDLDSSTFDTKDFSNGCGGIQVPEENLADMIKAVKDAFSNSKNDNNVDKDELQDIIENSAEELAISISSGNSMGSMTKLSHDSNLAINWEDLLYRINPSVKDHGIARETYNWNRPPRRMGSFYPEIIMPSWKKKDVMDTSGDEIPTFLIFVDVSGSIPQWIANKAVEMALSVPQDKIKARVFSFETSVHEIDMNAKNKRIRMGGGTNFNAVMSKVLEVKEDTNKFPYVLVITDFCDSFSSNSRDWFNELRDKWFWMEIPVGNSSYSSYSQGKIAQSNIASWRRSIQAQTQQEDGNFYKLEDFSNLTK